ncbi:MAG: glycosyltransferase family 8 protein [Lachnospiraceae bacterium]
MNILYILDNNYVPQVAAGICSVCENNKGVKDICFFIVSLHISKQNEEMLSSFVKGYEGNGIKRSTVFVEVENVADLFDFTIDTKGWNPVVLIRLVLDRLLPESVHRVIYMDGDTIVRGNLESMWNTDMKECAIGAAIEPTCSKDRKEKLGLKKLPYYNAGIMLIDLDHWRANQTGKEILDFYRNNGGFLFANDQDAINGSQKGKIVTLSCTYNYHNTYDIYNYRIFKYCDYDVPSKEEMKEIKKDPVIIHYLGEERPWRLGNTHRFRDDYFKYLDMTPWKGMNIEEGWKRYFFCWRIFNFVMKPFPFCRLYIINTLMPILLKKKHK